MPLPKLSPPLLNSACPWATTEADLQALLDCESTGAVTTRTCLLGGFEHDDTKHQHTFFNEKHEVGNASSVASLNTYGYSPLPLSQYLAIISKIVKGRSGKCVIISVTGSAESVVECYRRIEALEVPCQLAMEINLSCPNIPDKPPPAYSGQSLMEYLQAVKDVKNRIPVGIKTPPYTYHGQFQTLIDALLEVEPCPVDFITATNTLGSSLVLADDRPAINSAAGTGIGGMAGVSLHPLALGNIRTIRTMLDEHEELKSIDIIGVGGVSDHAAYKRMLLVGATYVAAATALGSRGIEVFGKILQP